MDELRVQGRVVTPDELDGIRGLIAAHPQWGRYHLSVHLAQQWNWRNGAGQLNYALHTIIEHMLNGKLCCEPI